MRRALALARLPIAATAAAGLALAFLPGRRALVLDVYVLVLGAFVLALLVVSIRRASPAPTTSPFERALSRRPRRGERLPDLERLEREVALAGQTAADVHFRFRPRLRPIAARRLHARRGIDLDSDPDAARRVLGDELWEVVRPDREPPRRRDAPGLPPAAVERLIAALERL